MALPTALQLPGAVIQGSNQERSYNEIDDEYAGKFT
jgi:hypothetical protein